MQSGDWSSDVCSSDLLRTFKVAEAFPRPRLCLSSCCPRRLECPRPLLSPYEHLLSSQPPCREQLLPPAFLHCVASFQYPPYKAGDFFSATSLGMWDPGSPNQGSNCYLLHWKPGVLTPASWPGKSLGPLFSAGVAPTVALITFSCDHYLLDYCLHRPLPSRL